jgi:hypothetical protein
MEMCLRLGLWDPTTPSTASILQLVTCRMLRRDSGCLATRFHTFPRTLPLRRRGRGISVMSRRILGGPLGRGVTLVNFCAVSQLCISGLQYVLGVSFWVEVASHAETILLCCQLSCKSELQFVPSLFLVLFLRARRSKTIISPVSSHLGIGR